MASMCCPARASFSALTRPTADIVLYGHTHQQTAEWAGETLVVNPGSAGDARDPRNGRRLSCAVLDLAQGEVRIIDYSV